MHVALTRELSPTGTPGAAGIMLRASKRLETAAFFRFIGGSILAVVFSSPMENVYDE